VRVSEQADGGGRLYGVEPFLATDQPKRGTAMDLETLIIAVFYLVDDFVRDLCCGHELRQRGPRPVLADSEVLTAEIVGEFLGLDTDRGPHAYFRHHFGHLFPGPRAVHRTTFARQAANLRRVKQALWRYLAAATRHDPALALVDSLPVPACRFARAHRCRGFRGLAAFGYDALAHRTFYGFRLHLRVAWPGVITAAALAPATRPTSRWRPSSSPASPAGRWATRATGARPSAPSWHLPGSP
jgi:hypothetical protein